MRTHPAFPLVLLLAALLALPAPAAGEKPLVVAATIFPVADIARQVGGALVRVIQVLPAGASPHTFDLTPGKVRELQPARLVFKIGIVDDWIDGIAESLPRVAIISLHKEVARLPSHDDIHGHRRGVQTKEEDFDPHYWLSAANGAIMANTIAAALAAADPAHGEVYKANGRRYAGELSELHAELQARLARLKNKKIIVLHDGWRYFAAAYGLEIAAVFQPSPGREPAPRELQQLYAAAKRSAVRVIFSEPQLPAASLEPLLNDLGLRLAILDPLGGARPGDSYIELLRRNARVILPTPER